MNLTKEEMGYLWDAAMEKISRNGEKLAKQMQCRIPSKTLIDYHTEQINMWEKIANELSGELKK